MAYNPPNYPYGGGGVYDSSMTAPANNGQSRFDDRFNSVPASSDPYAPRSSDPYPPRSSDPYPPRSSDPYPPRSSDPYPPRSSDPYPPRSSDPYPPRSSDPYPARSNDPYPPRSSDPYPPRSSDPYPPRSNDPYPPRSSDPYPPPRANDPYPPPRANDPYPPPRANDPYPPPRANDPYPPPRANDPYPPPRASDPYPPPRSSDPYPPREDNSYGSRRDDSYGPRGGDSYSRDNGPRRDSYDSRPPRDNSYGPPGNDSRDRSRGNDMNGSRGRDSYRSRGHESNGPRDQGHRSNSYNSRGGESRDRGNRDRGGRDDRSSDRREKSEEPIWKTDFNDEDMNKHIDEMILLNQKKQSNPIETNNRSLANEKNVIVKNIPKKITSYQMQLLLGTCGPVENFYLLDSNNIQAGVVAEYNGIAASYRAIRLLDKLHIHDALLDVNPYCTTVTKLHIFSIEIDWVTLHNDDAARRLIRLVMNDYDLHPVGKKGNSKDGFGPWVEIYKGDDPEIKAWEHVQLVYIGDQRARWFRTHQKPGVPMQRFVEKDRAIVDEVVDVVDNVITSNDDCLIISSLVHDFITFEKSALLPPDAPELLTVKSVIQIPDVIQKINQATSRWQYKFPDLKIIWLLPHPVNFAQYNQILVSNAGFDINLEEILQTQHEADAKVFFSTISDLKSKWKDFIQNAAFIHLSEIFFRKQSRADAFRNDEKIIWPKNFTIDGLNPAEKMTRSLWNALQRWIKNIGLDPIKVAEKKNYTKPAKAYDGVVTKTINGIEWKCGESCEQSRETGELGGHLDRLDAIWQDGDAKMKSNEETIGKEALTNNINSVKSNIMNILNVHSKVQRESNNPTTNNSKDSFSLRKCRNALEDVANDFGILSAPVQSFVNEIHTASQKSDTDCSSLSNSDFQILIKTIIDKLGDLEEKATNKSDKSKYISVKSLMYELQNRM